jgi:hypothetical protein
VSNDKDILQRRSTVVELNNAAGMIENLKIDKGLIIGEITTLSSFKGPDLAGLIHDSINFGFSLRALGSVEQLSDGSVQVVEPMIPITYDKNMSLLEVILIEQTF